MASWFLHSDRVFTADPDRPPLIEAYIEIDGERIVDVHDAMPSGREEAEVHDVTGHMVTPGFIDAHTHLVHAGSRHHELGRRLGGASYFDLQVDSGIMHTVKRTRQASYEALYERARASLTRMLSYGVTTVEAKSGYGLDKETELRCLAIHRELDQNHPVDVVSTYMGPHAVPPEFDTADAYLDFVIDEVLPVVKARDLATFVDVFCETHFFSIDQSRRFLLAAKEMGFGLKVHADEIESTGGAELAAEVGAVSAEHLMAASPAGIKAMAQAHVTACLLPCTTYFLMKDSYAPVRAFQEAGVNVALATDFNPGSSPCENIQFVQALGVYMMRMQPSDVLLATTRQAAMAVGRNDIGQIKAGFLADLVVTYVSDPDQFVYRPGSVQTKQVYKRGRLVFRGHDVPRLV